MEQKDKLREKIHGITSLLARKVVGEASKKIVSGFLIVQHNEEADKQIKALIEPLIEEADKKAIEAYGILKYDEGLLDGIGQGEKQERERIWAWGCQMCDTYEHTNIPVPEEMGGGMIKKNDRRRRRCPECWTKLLSGKP